MSFAADNFHSSYVPDSDDSDSYGDFKLFYQGELVYEGGCWKDWTTGGEWASGELKINKKEVWVKKILLKKEWLDVVEQFHLICRGAVEKYKTCSEEENKKKDTEEIEANFDLGDFE